LTINTSSSTMMSATACDSYMWSCNGMTYTQSGVYTCSGTGINGCPTTVTLDLTINQSTSNTTSATACDSYVWSVDGNTYVNSGTYTATSMNSAGCPHTEILNLTINSSTSSTTNATACDSYTWSCNAQTYTQSGTYTCVSTNASGCSNVSTLNLTINNSTSNTTSASACGSYTWSVNGQTYSQSGTYTSVSTNSAGCSHTEILNLTINPAVPTTITLSKCVSYTWPCNGQTYTQSGTYTCGSGCNQVNLILTINPLPTVSASPVSGCQGAPVILAGSPAGGTYNLPNPYTGSATSYTYYITSAAGCTNSATSTITYVGASVVGLTVSNVTGVSATVSWGGSGQYFEIRYKLATSSSWTTVTGTSSPKVLNGLTAGSAYNVQVRGFCNTSGAGPTSWVAASFTTTAAPGCVAPTPTTTTNITKNTAKLNWTHPGALFYTVRYKKTTASSWTNAGTVTPAFKNIINLQANTQYEFQVQAKCTNNIVSAWSASGFFTTLANKLGDVDPTSVSTDFNIYPNPTQNELNVDFTVDQNSSVVLKVVDMSGRVVKQVQTDALEGMNNVTISLGDLSSGIYTLQVVSDDKLVHTTRVTKN